MAEITAAAVKQLREKTGAGMMECKNALVEAEGNEEQAIEILRKRGLASAQKARRPHRRRRNCRLLHPHGRQGRRAGRSKLRNRFCGARRRVSAARERYCDAHRRGRTALCFARRKFPAKRLEKEREIARAQAKNDPKNANKPDQVIDKIVEGRLHKFYEENVLMDQPFVKDPAKTVGELVTEKVAKTGEKITIRRFTRYKMGEGLERRDEDFGGEVASLIG